MAAPFTLSPLPYDEAALAPIISAKTISFHFHKHHQSYVDALNKLIVGTRFIKMSVEEIVRATMDAEDDRERHIFNSAGQVWNHDFYWRSLSPKPSQPTGALKMAIERDFGSVDAAIKALIESGLSQFGSGWVWLVSKGGHLSIESSADAMSPMARAVNCLLTIDVWEHAY